MEKSISKLGSVRELCRKGKTTVASKKFGLKFTMFLDSDSIRFKLIYGGLSYIPNYQVPGDDGNMCIYARATYHVYSDSKIYGPIDDFTIRNDLDILDLTGSLEVITKKERGISKINITYISDIIKPDEDNQEFYIHFETEFCRDGWVKVK